MPDSRSRLAKQQRMQGQWAMVPAKRQNLILSENWLKTG
jgi:hypothetical protein